MSKGYTSKEILDFDYKEIKNEGYTYIYTIKDYADADFPINDLIRKIYENFDYKDFTRVKECFEIMSLSKLTDFSLKYLFIILLKCYKHYNEKQFTEIKIILEKKKKKL
jgi:hypothetical protein